MAKFPSFDGRVEFIIDMPHLLYPLFYRWRLDLAHQRQTAPNFRLMGSQTLRQQVSKYACIYGLTGAWPPEHVLWRCLPVTVAKVRSPDKCLSFFLGGTRELQKGQGQVPRRRLQIYVPRELLHGLWMCGQPEAAAQDK